LVLLPRLFKKLAHKKQKFLWKLLDRYQHLNVFISGLGLSQTDVERHCQATQFKACWIAPECALHVINRASESSTRDAGFNQIAQHQPFVGSSINAGQKVLCRTHTLTHLSQAQARSMKLLSLVRPWRR